MTTLGTAQTIPAVLQIKSHAVTSITDALTDIARSIVMPVVTGTGSITATPTLFTDAVTTMATSTTPTTGQETVLGKRTRKTSTKYDEDFEKPAIVVRSCTYVVHVLLKRILLEAT